MCRDTSVFLGAFISVLFALGMLDQLKEIADASYIKLDVSSKENNFLSRFISPRESTDLFRLQIYKSTLPYSFPICRDPFFLKYEIEAKFVRFAVT